MSRHLHVHENGAFARRDALSETKKGYRGAVYARDPPRKKVPRTHLRPGARPSATTRHCCERGERTCVGARTTYLHPRLQRVQPPSAFRRHLGQEHGARRRRCRVQICGGGARQGAHLVNSRLWPEYERAFGCTTARTQGGPARVRRRPLSRATPPRHIVWVGRCPNPLEKFRLALPSAICSLPWRSRGAVGPCLLALSQALAAAHSRHTCVGAAGAPAVHVPSE